MATFTCLTAFLNGTALGQWLLHQEPASLGLLRRFTFAQGVRAADCQNHLHQLHVCLPSREGHTRLLYRMAMDFMDWTRHVPGIQLFWKNIAGQVPSPHRAQLQVAPPAWTAPTPCSCTCRGKRCTVRPCGVAVWQHWLR
jgi:hypothetical protein